MKNWYAISNNANAGEISIYDEIGAFGITAKDFEKQLNALGKVKIINPKVLFSLEILVGVHRIELWAR
jgi:hypothetical protein